MITSAWKRLMVPCFAIVMQVPIVGSATENGASSGKPKGEIEGRSGSELERILRKEVSLLEALDRHAFAAIEARRRTERADKALEATMERIEAAMERLGEARAHFERARREFVLLLRTELVLRPLTRLTSIVVGVSGDRALRTSALLQRLERTYGRRLAELAAALKEARTAQFVLGIERANAYVLREFSKQALQELNAEMKRRRLLLRAAERDRRLAQRKVAELKESESRLLALVRRRLSELPGPVDFERRKGRLRWPMAGAKVLVPFGPMLHPRFKTSIPHPGLTLGYEHGQTRNIRSVAYGKVAYVGDMRGYQDVVVVDHGSGYYTVYGGLARTAVKEGTIVREGTLLGEVARLPGEKYLKMYFELRRGARALDPLPFLRPRK